MQSGTVLADPGVDAGAVADGMARNGVKLHSLERYYLGTMDRKGFVFGFGALDPVQIRKDFELL